MSATVARVAPGPAAEAWSVRVPGSKSLTNRALLVAGVAAGRSRLIRPLVAVDTEAMAGVLRALGAGVTADGDDWLVDGLGGPPSGPATLYCGMGATVGRFVLPMLAAGDGVFTVDAHPQLRRRPLGPVLDALRAQGAVIHGDGFPLTLEASGLRGGEVEVDASVSGQFLSALLLASPFAATPMQVAAGAVASPSYVTLTRDVMDAFGAGDGYRACEYAVEPDASTASYFYAAAALTGSAVAVPGLDPAVTHQGDIALVDHLAAMRAGGGLSGVHVDMAGASDVFMTLACVAPFADSPTTIEGLAHVRVKESDRLAATAENLRRLGIVVDEGPDFISITPGTPRPDVRLPTYEDHRIAMAFALIGLRVPVELEDPGVTAKTCPEFWELWPATGAEVSLW